jgi:hypothetical protein
VYIRSARQQKYLSTQPVRLHIMDIENTQSSRDAGGQGLSLTAKADEAAERLHKDEAEITQYVVGTVEVWEQPNRAL